MKANIFCFGTNTIRNTFETSEPTVTVSDSVLWQSLYAVTESNSPAQADFTQKVLETTAKYFVVDLYSLSFDVSTTDGKYGNDTANEAPKQNLFEKVSTVQSVLNAFSEIIRKKFDSDHIILLNTLRSDYLLKGELLRKKFDNRSFNLQMRAYEDYFVSITGCANIDLCGSYFLDFYNKYGFASVNYEPSLYLDILSKIRFYISLDKKTIRSFSIPALFYKLERYKKYGWFLEKTFSKQLLFLHGIHLEHFLSTTSVSFVEKYERELLKLESTANNQIKTAEAVKRLDCAEISQTYRWFCMLEGIIPIDESVPTDALVNYKMDLLDKLVRLENQKQSQFSGVRPIITAYNLTTILIQNTEWQKT